MLLKRASLEEEKGNLHIILPNKYKIIGKAREVVSPR